MDTTSVVLSEVGSYAATLRMAVVNSVEVEVLSNKQNQSFAKCQQTSKKKNETNPVAWAINETRNVELVTLVSEQKQLLEKGKKKNKRSRKAFLQMYFYLFLILLSSSTFSEVKFQNVSSSLHPDLANIMELVLGNQDCLY